MPQRRADRSGTGRAPEGTGPSRRFVHASPASGLGRDAGYTAMSLAQADRMTARTNPSLPWLLAAALVLPIAATPASPQAQAQAPSSAARSSAVPATAPLPALTVHKHPSCGCCNKWIEHMRDAGFTVAVEETTDMQPVKRKAGVPESQGSCHTAQVGGYFIEGHVPAADVQRLLHERPKARGLAVPGMPLGSPGMEHPDGTTQPYAVSLVLEDGSVREFSRHPAD